MEAEARKNKIIEEFEFTNLSESRKKLLLQLLGFQVDEEGFIVQSGKRHLCPYTKEYVQFEEASILPGSTVVIKTSPYTISSYISDYLTLEDSGNGD